MTIFGRFTACCFFSFFIYYLPVFTRGVKYMLNHSLKFKKTFHIFDYPLNFKFIFGLHSIFIEIYHEVKLNYHNELILGLIPASMCIRLLLRPRESLMLILTCENDCSLSFKVFKVERNSYFYKFSNNYYS